MYRGRFAPTPNGLLHRGSVVAALASWLDARAHGGQWLLRFDDVDFTRCLPSVPTAISQQLSRLGLLPDAPPSFQSQGLHHYQQAFAQLQSQGKLFACRCSRKEIADSNSTASAQPLVYPGTCRKLERRSVEANAKNPANAESAVHAPTQPSPARSWRVRVAECAPASTVWHDRRLGAQSQSLPEQVGDFIVRRADAVWAYQLAVVVDDAREGITDVVRGQDLAMSTARQIFLQELLGLPTPRYLHTPLVLDAQGRKLSKSQGAAALAQNPTVALQQAVQTLQLPLEANANDSVSDLLLKAVAAWRGVYGMAGE